MMFKMHEESPNIIRLQVHLPNHQLITWNEDNAPDVQAIVEDQGNKDTTLTAYFKANAAYPEAWQLLYQNFPSKFVWKQKRGSGNQEYEVLQLAACTMPILALENASISVLF